MAAFSIPGTATSMPKTALPSRTSRRVQARDVLADQLKLAGVLERRLGAQRNLGGVGRELAVAQCLSARIDDGTFVRPALPDADAPSLRGGADEHFARGGARGAQALVEHRGRHRGAFFLDRRLLPECDLVGRPPRHEPDLDALPVRVEFLGEDLRQHRVGALPHFRLRQPERDLAARRDHDPIGNLDLDRVVSGGRSGLTHDDRHQQRCGRQGGSGEQEATRNR